VTSVGTKLSTQMSTIASKITWSGRRVSRLGFGTFSRRNRRPAIRIDQRLQTPPRENRGGVFLARNIIRKRSPIRRSPLPVWIMYSRNRFAKSAQIANDLFTETAT